MDCRSQPSYDVQASACQGCVWICTVGCHIPGKYSADTVELLWRVPVNAVRYEVYRDGVLQGTVTGGSYLQHGLRDGIDYAYEVVALDHQSNRLVASQLTINTADRAIPFPDKPFS